MKVTSTNNYYKISEINYIKHYFLSNLRVLCVVANVNFVLLKSLASTYSAMVAYLLLDY